LTEAKDVVAVATPGHTADHICVLVQEHDTTLFLAGDASYNESLMLAGKVDGVSPCERVSAATLNAISCFARTRPTVYLPTHDPESGARLANRCLVGRRVRTSPRDGSGTQPEAV
jgi:glyoxylase-like metal-dependent hydrolase (beta-lactamase superfamily II)